jgi:hypothetical protein
MEGPLNATEDIKNEKSVADKRKFRLRVSGVVVLVAIGMIVAVALWFFSGVPKKAGIGVPINSEGWEVIITDVHIESRINNDREFYTPKKEGMTFFVVHYTVDYKGSLGQSKFALYGTATTEKGETLAPDLFGLDWFGKDDLLYSSPPGDIGKRESSVTVGERESSVTGVASSEKPTVIKPSDVIKISSARFRHNVVGGLLIRPGTLTHADDVPIEIKEGKAFTLKSENHTLIFGKGVKPPMKANFVFIIPEANTSQTYKIKFLDVPNVVFLAKAKP